MAYVDFAAIKAAVSPMGLPDGILAGNQSDVSLAGPAQLILFHKNLDRVPALWEPETKLALELRKLFRAR